MSERIHDDEPDTSETIVRVLLDAECPQWVHSPIEYLDSSGTDNAMWRIHLDAEPDVVVRLPRRPGAAAGVLQEMAVLQQIEHASIGTAVKTPTVCHVGQPHEVFAHHWSILEWQVVDEPVEDGFVHGDLIPGNLLVDRGRPTAIIDWGGAGRGDTAQDFAPAWAVLDASARAAFKEAVGTDDAAWIRGRTFELEHAVGGVLYYVPRRHPPGDVMARTLDRILTAP